MTKLSDTQLVLLSAAARSEDGAVYLPERLRGGAAEKVLASLCQKGLIEATTGTAEGTPSGSEGGKTPYRISQAGLDIIGIEGPADDSTPEGEGVPSSGLVPAEDASHACKGGGTYDPEAGRTKMPVREGSKLAGVAMLLSQPGGASIDELTTATNWLPHTTRAALTGLRKRGSAVQRSKREDGTTIYSMGKPALAQSEGDELQAADVSAEEVAR